MSTPGTLLDRFENQQCSWRHVWVAVSLALCVMLNTFDSNVLGFALTPLARQFHMAAVQMGYVATSVFVGQLVGISTLPPLADRWGRRRFYLFVTGSVTVASLLAGLSQSYAELLVIRFIEGLFIGPMTMIGFTYLAELGGRRFRGALVATSTISQTLGTTMVPVLASFLLPTLGWRSLFYATFIIGIAVTLWALTKIQDTVPNLVQRGEFAQAASVLAYFGSAVDERAVLGAGASGSAPTPEFGHRRWNLRHFVEVWRRPRVPVTLTAWMFQVSALFAILGVGAWLPTLLIRYDLKAYQYSIVLLGTVGGLCGALIALFFLDRWGRKPLLIIGAAGPAVCYSLLGFSHSVFLITALAFLGQGTGAGLLFPTLNAWLNESYAGDIRAAGAAVSQVPGYLMAIFGSIAIGYILANGGGLQQVGLLFGLPSIISLCFAIWLAKETKGQPLRPTDAVEEVGLAAGVGMAPSGR